MTDGPAMRISGFTIAKNAVQFGYPLAESLRSLLPLVDELVVAVGDCEDGTWELVQSLGDPKIKAFRTVWDPKLRAEGLVLSQQTNLALQKCQGDWGVYLQADEVLHEKDLDRFRAVMRSHLDDGTEGLWQDYLHFYGSFQVVQDHPVKWYKKAIRAVRLGRGVESWGDAMGFLVREKGLLRDLKAKPSGVTVYHYGHVRPPQVMLEKRRNLRLFYHEDAIVNGRYEADKKKMEDFYDDRGHLRFFKGTHPRVMTDLVAAQDWEFDHRIGQQPPRWLRLSLFHLTRPLTRLWASLRKRLTGPR